VCTHAGVVVVVLLLVLLVVVLSPGLQYGVVFGLGLRMR
jgi:hypothetical protein